MKTTCKYSKNNLMKQEFIPLTTRLLIHFVLEQSLAIISCAYTYFTHLDWFHLCWLIISSSSQTQHYHHLHSLHQLLYFLLFFSLHPIFWEQTMSGGRNIPVYSMLIESSYSTWCTQIFNTVKVIWTEVVFECPILKGWTLMWVMIMLDWVGKAF